jgi:hypothetical protein
MRMFKRPPADESTTTTYDPAAIDGRDRVVTTRSADVATAPAPGTPVARRWHDPTRAFATLLGVAVAGFLAWLTTRIGDGTNGKYWAEYGILAGAGLAIAISQLVGGWTKWGRPRFSPSVFLLAFVPTLIAVGWILGFHQPGANWLRTHTVNWSGDLGIADVVKDMGELVTMLSFGLGLVFGLCFDTTGGRVAVTAPADADADAAVEPAASEPITREREVVRS